MGMWPGHRPLPAPRPVTIGGGDLTKYALAATFVSLVTVAVDKPLACNLQSAFTYLAKSLGTAPLGEMAIPEPAECTAKCAPCIPPAGTECYEPHSGHTHGGFDRHFHLWWQ